MPTDRELMQQALDALFNLRWAASERDKKNRIRQFDEFMDGSDEAIEALRARLAQPEQEPIVIDHDGTIRLLKNPPQREWQGLTDEEVESLDCTTVNACDWNEYEVYKPSVQEFARAIEAKLKEKNT